MKLSELIAQLEAAKATHGDLPIAIAPEDEQGYLFKTSNLYLELLRVRLNPCKKPYLGYSTFITYPDKAEATHLEFSLK